MVATVEESPVKHRKRINYALAGTLLHTGLSMDEIAVKVGAANANTLRSALSRKGVTRSNARLITDVNPSQSHVETLTARISRQASDIIKDSIGERLLAQASKLSSRKVGKLANVGQGEAAVLKTLAETHRTLYGGAEMNVLIFGASSMERELSSAQQSQAPEQNSQGVIDLPPTE